MRPFLTFFAAAILLGTASAASKPHVITFGRWTTVKLLSGPNEDQPAELKIRPLYVDAAQRAYIVGTPHEISDRLLVVERMLRVNDTLPSESLATPRWVWLRGGWLVVDRTNGHISPVNLPEFDSDFSVANWYRDYVAYCGVSADGRKLSDQDERIRPKQTLPLRKRHETKALLRSRLSDPRDCPNSGIFPI